MCAAGGCALAQQREEASAVCLPACPFLQLHQQHTERATLHHHHCRRTRVEAACREIGGQLVEAGQEARSSSMGSHRFSFSFLARNWNSAWGECLGQRIWGGVAEMAWRGGSACWLSGCSPAAACKSAAG